MRLVGGRELHQLHATRAPVALRRDPRAGPQVVAGLEVFVAGEVAVALHQAEAAQRAHGERGGQLPARVLQRAPQPFAVAGGDHQAIGVVYLGAEVVAVRLVLAELEHAGERGDAQRGDRPAQVEPRTHVDRGLRAGRDLEAVGTGGTWRFQQRVDDERSRAGRRALQPEDREARELLALPADGVDRQPACRQPVTLLGAERAEVAGAEEDDELVLVVGPVQRMVHAHAGVADVAPALRRERIAAVVEVAAVKAQVPHLALRRDLVDLHRLGLVLAEMEEHGRERQRVLRSITAPQRTLGAEPDVAVLVVAERLQLGRQHETAGAVGLGGQLPGLLGHVVEAERARRGGQQPEGRRDKQASASARMKAQAKSRAEAQAQARQRVPCRVSSWTRARGQGSKVEHPIFWKQSTCPRFRP